MFAPARRFLMIAGLAALVAACGQNGAGGTGGGAATAGGDEMALGSANAKVTMIEYASVTCPHCAQWNADVFPAFKAKYIDTGQVRYVFREYITEPRAVAAAGFLLARCAGKDKYFGVIDALFHGQTEMAQTGDTRGVLYRIGQSAGMTNEQISACVSDPKALEALQARFDKTVREAGIEATPTFVIGDKKLSGVQSLAQLDAAIQPLLK